MTRHSTAITQPEKMHAKRIADAWVKCTKNEDDIYKMLVLLGIAQRSTRDEINKNHKTPSFVRST